MMRDCQHIVQCVSDLCDLRKLLIDSVLLPPRPIILACGSWCRVEVIEFIDINGSDMVATTRYTAHLSYG